MITVVIPSYNRRTLTARAVKSVLAQTYRDFEILVVDDHSRPEELFVPEPGTENRVRVIRHEANAGVSAARNTGVREARGALVAFLDSDDLWLPHRLAEHAALFARQPAPEKTLVYSVYYTIEDADAVPTSEQPLKPGQPLGEYLFLEYGCLHVNTWLASKKLLERFPFDPGLRQSEDWDALLRMEAAGIRFVHAPAPSALRHVDLRTDRLSSFTDLAAQTRFLEQNAGRLGPRARLVFEAIFREQQQPRKSALGSLWFKIRFFSSAPDLPMSQRIGLIFRYIVARLRHKLRTRRGRRPIDAVAGTKPA